MPATYLTPTKTLPWLALTSLHIATGAGDCFNGAFLASAFAGQSLNACFALTAAAATIALPARGTRTALPNLEMLAGMVPNMANFETWYRSI
ncbi:MAG: PfkB family carbohydrate kinase [Rhizobiaceae bacterium]